MMNDRLKHLLSLVIEDVIETGEPVGSHYLVETYRLRVSSATVRNWFTELETDGYIVQQHTSSGRVPTEKGYRLYVEGLVDTKPPRVKTRQALREAYRIRGDEARKLKSLARAMADTAEMAVVAWEDDIGAFATGLSHLFAQPEFHDWNRVVTLSESLDQLDDILRHVHSLSSEHPIVFIGRSCPFGSACSSIFLSISERACIGLLGPMRMDYREGFALLGAVKQLLYS